jgi:hypothetical protein
MKRRLLSLHPLYQSLDRVKRRLIAGSEYHALVVLDLAVEFDAPVTHCIPPFWPCGIKQGHLSFYYDGAAI